MIDSSETLRHQQLPANGICEISVRTDEPGRHSYIDHHQDGRLMLLRVRPHSDSKPLWNTPEAGTANHATHQSP